MKKSNNNTDFTSETIGARLKRLRKEKGYIEIAGKQYKLTQVVIADKVLKYSDCRMYRDCENDKRIPSVDNLITLANFYGVSVDYLLCRSHYISCDNELISKTLGLSDKSIENIKQVIDTDQVLNTAIDKFDLPPCLVPSSVDRIKPLNLILSSDSKCLARVLNAINTYMVSGYDTPIFMDNDGYMCLDRQNKINLLINGKQYIKLARGTDNIDDNVSIEISDTIVETSALNDIKKSLDEIKRGVAD